MDDQAIKEIHDAGAHLVVAVTGGGASAISSLLSVPGASRSVLEAHVPYHGTALTRYLGKEPEQACSMITARQMAMASFQRARELTPEPEASLLGVGCTAALATDRDRKGQNRCFIAIQSLEETRTTAILFNKGVRTRVEEETLCAEAIINTIRRALYLPEAPLPLQPGEDLESECVVAQPGWRELIVGRIMKYWQSPGSPNAIFPGTFSPFHHGHQEITSVAAEILNTEIALEISVFNVDKAPLDYIDMAHRLDSIGGQFPLVFTHAPTFLEKARLFPGATFIVGSDTMERIVSIRYYNDNETARDDALKEILGLGNSFLVFGRASASGFVGLDDLDLPAPVRKVCTGVPESRFRADVSSTQLRTGKSEPEDNYRQ